MLHKVSICPLFHSYSHPYNQNCFTCFTTENKCWKWKEFRIFCTSWYPIWHGGCVGKHSLNIPWILTPFLQCCSFIHLKYSWVCFFHIASPILLTNFLNMLGINGLPNVKTKQKKVLLREVSLPPMSIPPISSYPCRFLTSLIWLFFLFVEMNKRMYIFTFCLTQKVAYYIYSFAICFFTSQYLL